MTVTVISSTGTVSSPVTTADTFIPGSSSRMGTSVPSPTPGSTTTKSSGITAAESRSASFTSFTSASATPSQTLHPLHLPPVGAIAGAVIAVLILIAGCVFLVWALHRRRRKQLEVEPVVRDNDIGTDWWQPVSHPLAAADFEHPSVSQTDKLAPNGFQPGNISSWAAAQMPRQNQILLRENEEFWDEIEDLHRENEKLRLNDSHEAYTTGNLPGPHY
ncbi:hypothetical protein L208DRAFT_597158 [Tricholoma matsutake]|nr:hypothetical protein L208DRAFT_597158 [Tricholoma matsutake 945]